MLNGGRFIYKFFCYYKIRLIVFFFLIISITIYINGQEWSNTIALMSFENSVGMTCDNVRYPEKRRNNGSLFSTVYEDDKVMATEKQVPRILHQMYKSTKIPAGLQTYIKSWIKNHPQWKYVFWSDDDIHEFVKTYYPQYYSTFINVPETVKRKKPLYRSDMARYLILDYFGGVYADLDLESNKSLEHLRHHHAVISREPASFGISAGRDTDVQACNAFMMSIPRHPIWKAMMSTVMERVAKQYELVFATGPVGLCYTLRKYQCSKPWSTQSEDTVFLAPSPYFYNRLDWMDGEQRIRFVKFHCQWSLFRTLRNPVVKDICKYTRTYGKIDWRHDPIHSPQYAWHHGSQIYDSDRLNLRGDRLLDIHDIVDRVISFRELLELKF